MKRYLCLIDTGFRVSAGLLALLSGVCNGATLEDDFSNGLGNWTESTQGLENDAPAGYDAPDTSGGELSLGGFTDSQYWFGNSLVSVADFDKRLRTEISVRRVSLTGSGTAWRSSLWIYGDEGHYVHFSQNIGENGWSWNARDDEGTGTLNPTGGGNNIADLDGLDAEEGEFEMGIRTKQIDATTIEITLVHDGTDVATHRVTNFPATFKVILTGQARAIGDEVNAVFDDFSITQEENIAPLFSGPNLELPEVNVGTAYSQSIAAEANDPDDETLTFSKASGPDWVTVSAAGVLSGTPTVEDTGQNVVVVEASDGTASTQTKARILVVDPDAELAGVVFKDDFSGSLDKWTASSKGLENDAPMGYDPAAVEDGQLVLGGFTEDQYWFGNSLVSGVEFNSTYKTEVSVTRVSLTGGGTAWRSSLWILGDDAHYMHFSQNVGETGWSWNARDDGGLGTLSPTGSGNNIPDLDAIDSDEGSFKMAIRIDPIAEGVINVTLLHEDTEVASHQFTNFPGLFSVVLTGQARAAGDEVTAVFDDLLVVQETVENLPPTFLSDPVALDTGSTGEAYSQSVAGEAVDGDGDPLTFSKTSGPDWISVSSDGVVSGTPSTSDTGINSVVIAVTDGKDSGETTVRIRIVNPNTPNIPLLGWWPLNEGAGDITKDATGRGWDGEIFNADSGGLGTDGSVWLEDADRGTVASFNGTDNTGAYVFLGTGSLPQMTDENGFTWMFWANSQQAPNNDIIFGNRYNTDNGEFAPRQFVKFTTSRFEWDTNNVQGFDYDDLPEGEWMHHAIVKSGLEFTYYQNGEEMGSGFADAAPQDIMPLYLAGQGVENWAGYLSDVRIYQTSLTGDEVAEAMVSEPGTTPSRFEVKTVERKATSVVLTWNSKEGEDFAVDYSEDMKNWLELTDSFPSGGEQTTYEAQDPEDAPSFLYYRVRRQ
ncbi:MAG: hypothetical protein KDN22_03655 [Verrucomicrobiae bacterium]|nr:hypothetical protein [Verrucomicrobiae bacterium]